MNQPFASFIFVFYFILLRTAVTDFNIQLGQAYFKAQTHQSSHKDVHKYVISKLFSSPSLWGESSFCHILQLAGGGRSSLMLLSAANEFEKQSLLYFQPSDWPVAQIS